MATITLYAGKVNQMSSLINNAKKAVKEYKSDLKSLKSKVLKIDSSICNVDDVINSVKSSTQTQGDKIDALDNLKKDVNEFVADVVRIDGDAADAINQSKNDFYDKYEYLKPDIEKNWLEEKVDNACEWCKEHWKEILITVTIVIGAVLAIVAVVASGGLALVPLLTTTLTTLGVSAGTALTIATVTSYTVAAIAILSTLGSSTLNIIDTWGNVKNSTFKAWQKGLNILSAVSNGFYSIGNMYNSIKGISGKEFIARQKAIENGKIGYSNLDANHPTMKHKPGAKYDKTRKSEILNENRTRNNGQLRSDKTGKILEQPKKSMKGVKPPKNEAQIDHIVARANGGTNSFSNAQVIERAANSAKSNQVLFTDADYIFHSVPDKSNTLAAIFSGVTGTNSFTQGMYNAFKEDENEK